MKRMIRKMWNWITRGLMILTLALAVLLAGTRFAGLQGYAVLSGSMEPEYHVGALVYVKSVDDTQLKAGDVITFMMDDTTVVTRRIVEVVANGENANTPWYRTKGDAEEMPSGELVQYQNVIGTPVFAIPWLGYVANYIQHPPGTYVAIGVIVILLISVLLPDRSKNDRKKKSET